MGERTASDQDPLQAWTDLVWRTVGTWPGAGFDSTIGDRWTSFIQRLWQANPYRTLLPADSGNTADAYQQLLQSAIRNPARVWAGYTDLLQGYTKLMSNTALKLWGVKRDVEPVAAPDKTDRRFAAPGWQENAIFDTIKQSYLLAATSLLKTLSDIDGLDQRQHRKLLFSIRQFADALSPSNFAMTNPEVIQEAMATGGESLVRGTQNLLRDLAAGEIKMTDTDAYEVGRNLATTPGQVVFRNKLMELIQYSPQTEQVSATPLVFIPNWINKYYIVDLQQENSLIRFLVQNGITVFMVSWKNPDSSLEDITFDDYMELGPLTAFRIAKEITGAPEVNAVGYCIGGTLLAMTLAYLDAIGDKSVTAATFFVSLLDFSEVGDTSVFVEEPNVALVEEEMRQRGYLDSRQLATMFNLLRANDLIWSCVVNNYLLGKEAPAFDLLFWNNDGTRCPRAAHSFYLHNTYVENNLIKPGKMMMKGVPIDLSRIRQDVYAVGSELDHLVPWRTAWRISQLTGGKVRFVVGGSGHIAGVINPPTKGRGYWTNDKSAASADEWFAGSQHHKGSWWPDWIEWLHRRSGERVAPPSMGSAKYSPIIPAPGTYVLEK